MEKQTIYVVVEGGICTEVYSKVDLEVIVLDFDDQRPEANDENNRRIEAALNSGFELVY